MRIQGAQGIELATDIEGPSNGELIILLHGGGQTRYSWSTLERRLGRKGYRVIAYDARGHGESDWSPTGDYALTNFVEDLAAVVKSEGRPVALVGASLGGLTSMVALANNPSIRCWALALVDVVPCMNAFGRARVIEFMAAHPDGFASVDEAIQVIAAYLPHRSRRPKERSGVMKNLRERGGRFYWHWDPAFLKSSRSIRSLPQLEPQLQSGDFPILLVRGDSSDVVTDSEAQSFAKRVPKAQIATIAGAAHMVAGDRNDAFSSVIEEFLARARQVGGTSHIEPHDTQYGSSDGALRQVRK